MSDVGEGGFVDASQRKSETVDRVADARDRDAVLSLDNIASMGYHQGRQMV
jgi:hypothetical protein